jgi:rfaE bifunctional protein kinase chain/domain
MTSRRFTAITCKYPSLRIAVVGDYSLDRYLEIDPRLNERSIETDRVVHNVTHVRSQPGSAGTIVNNLSALGIGTIYPIGFCGNDGEGFELTAALKDLSNVDSSWFIKTNQRHTFTYCKPLVIRPNQSPKELNRLDTKNWTPTPPSVERKLIANIQQAAESVDAIILMDQVDIADTGVITRGVIDAINTFTTEQSEHSPLILGDSRRGLREFPPIVFKMNRDELNLLTGRIASGRLDTVKRQAVAVAKKNGRPVFITMAEKGILGVDAQGNSTHLPALPVKGEIDIVGAGDAVTANLTASLAAGGTLQESISLANAAAHLVVHQLGTTGTASVGDLSELF